MALSGRRLRGNDLTDDTARQAVEQGNRAGRAGFGTFATVFVSLLALVFSGLSLYETVLRRASLRIFVPEVVHYGREPGGDRELFAVPMTIANHGARDAAVTGIRMIVRKQDDDTPAKTFFAAWFVDAAFFARSKGFDRATRTFDRNPRPKRPFAPIAVAGRTAFSGTVLFNVVGNTFPVAIGEAGTYEIVLRLETDLDDARGVADRLLTTQTEPIMMTMSLPGMSHQGLRRGELAQLRAVPEAPKIAVPSTEAPAPSTDAQ